MQACEPKMSNVGHAAVLVMGLHTGWPVHGQHQHSLLHESRRILRSCRMSH